MAINKSNEEKKKPALFSNENMLGSVTVYSEMIYGDTNNPILAEGTYKNIPFWIKNCRGNHPCCYIEIPKESNYFGRDYDYIPIYCHGGLTYADDTLSLVCDEFEERRWFVGWDYAHYGDASYYYDFPGKKWTVAELISDVYESIDSFLEVPND